MDGKSDEPGDRDTAVDKKNIPLTEDCRGIFTDAARTISPMLSSSTFLMNKDSPFKHQNNVHACDNPLDSSGDDKLHGHTEDVLNISGDSVSILGMVDKMMSEISPNGHLLDLNPVMDCLHPESSSGGISDRDSSGVESVAVSVKHERSSPGSDNSEFQPRHASHAGLGPPSGPFVVGDQMDVVLDSYVGEAKGFIESSTVDCDLTTGQYAPSLGFEQISFLDQLDKYKWRSGHGSNSRGSIPRQQKVRTDLTLADKVRLIGVSEATGKSQRSLAAEFHISVGSVNNILRRKHEYRAAYEKNEDVPSRGCKVARRSAKVHVYSELQVLVMQWLELAKTKIRPLTWPVVLEKAKQFATKMNVTTFSTSATWLEDLRHSMDIPLRAMPVGIPDERDASIMGSWRKMLPFLVQGYQPENVFCVSETTMYYRCLPDCCYIGGPLCQNVHNFMEVLEHRFTVLLCCNLLGERMKPLVVSHSPCPASLRGVPLGDLPVVWCHQPNAVITTDIFAGWLLTVEASMAQERRHIALFMEMTPTHLSSTLLKHVSLKVFLDNSSHLLQPLNQGIIRDFKAGFRRRLLQTALATGRSNGDAGEQAVKNVTELDALFWIQEAWRSVSLDTIHTCFQNTGFMQVFQTSTALAVSRGIGPLPADYQRLVQEAGRLFRFTPMSPDVYAEFDSQLQCHLGEMEEWEKSLLVEATGGRIRPIKQEPGADSVSGESLMGLSYLGSTGNGSLERLRPSDALDCLAKLKRFSSSSIGLLTSVFELESLILDSLGNSLARC